LRRVTLPFCFDERFLAQRALGPGIRPLSGPNASRLACERETAALARLQLNISL